MTYFCYIFNLDFEIIQMNRLNQDFISSLNDISCLLPIHEFLTKTKINIARILTFVP